MPFFVVVPICLVSTLVGLALLFSRRSRYLSAYFVLCPLAGVIVAFLFSSAVLFVLPRIFSVPPFSRWHWLGAIAMIVGYAGSIGLGATVGIATGAVLSYRVNCWADRRASWTRMDES